jgi:4'-phosphopantetheinyl transferase
VTSPLTLGTGDVHVWYARPEAVSDPALLRACERTLSTYERERRRRLRLERGRHEYLVAHALLRTCLSRYADVPPQAWRFETNHRGRPEISAPRGAPPLRFNLSHTAGLVACAVTMGAAIGVDVEDTRRSGRGMQVAERFFSTSEVADLRRLPESRRSRRFFEYWTLKEAYVKARGLGLALPLQRFSFRVRRGAPVSVSFDPQLGDRPESWHFALFRPTRRHVLAVGVQRPSGGPCAIQLRESIPLSAPPTV